MKINWGTVKPFAKEEHNIITCTIDENGDVIYLATDANDAFLNDGTEVTRRASHVEPEHFGYRVAFYILRLLGDKTHIAQWTREWPVVWRVNTRPVGGPILEGRWTNRQAAIDAEIIFLNDWFLERGIQ